MTNLEIACKAFGWSGGTIFQVSEHLGYRSVYGNELATMNQDKFIKLINDFLTTKVRK